MLVESVPHLGLIGRRIAGKYAIESLLGVGAMGAVFKARHVGLEQVVAIKVLHGQFLSEPTFAARFQREAQATVRLDHPNSVRVFDFGEEPDGLLYLAMEFLDGRDLAHVIVEDWPISNARIVGIMRQIVGALGAAHDAEIIHRDLKPENIMVLARTDDDGHPIDVCKVCDFGIAQLGDPRTARTPPATTRLTSRGLVIGTPEYMSPEQGRGDSLDARADIYSVGVILYELLTGRLPFEAESAIGIILKHASQAPLPPSQVRSGVHPGLEAICLRAMAKDPAARIQSARELRTALGALGMDVADPPRVDGPARTPRPETETAMAVAPESKRASRRGLAYLGIGAVVLALLGIGAARAMSGTNLPAHEGAAAVVTEKAALPAPVVEAPTAVVVAAVPPSTLVTRTEPRAVARPLAPAHPSPPLAHADVSEHATDNATPKPSALASAPPAESVKPIVPETPVAAIVPAAPAVVAAPSPPFDASTGRVTVGAVSNEQGVLRRDVLATISHANRAMAACYQGDLRAAALPKSGSGNLHLETDGSGVIVRARASVPFSPAVGTCVERSVSGLRIAGVDTGDAAADVALTFDVR